jgi:ketosteroid isomerase-like protein
MSSDPHIHVVLDYFDGCNTGEIEHLLRTLDHDVVHYFLPAVHPPIHGAEHLAKYWRKFKQIYDPTWKIDHLIGSGNEVVSEWSCAYTLPTSGSQMMFRGSEWYVMKNERIAEVRAYYEYDDSRDCQLNGFPYAARGYLNK